MDFSQLFTRSGTLLKEHPRVAIPFILNQFIFYALFFALVSLGFSTNFTNEFIVENYKQILLYGIGGYIVWLIVTIIFSCWGYYQNAMFLMNKKTTLLSSFFSSQRYFFKLLLIRVCFMIVIAIPIVLLVAFVVFAFMQHPLLGLAMILLSALLILAWVLFVSVKLFFVEVQLFIEKKGAISPITYIRQAYSFSKGKSGSIILLLLIIIVIHFIVNTATSNPFAGIILEYIKSFQIIIFFIIGFLFSLVLAIITGATSAFTNLLMIKSYLDLKKEDKTK